MSWTPPALAPHALERLAQARVLVVGLGGLGAHVALLLARSGVGHLVLADADRVEAVNLSRQPYFPEHVGRLKAMALGEMLRRIRPQMGVTLVPRFVAPDALPRLAAGCTAVVEAVDDAATKAALVEAALAAGHRVVSASGIGGVGAGLSVRRLGRLVVVGDECTPCAGATPPLAPRVTAAAALQADVVVGWIVDDCAREDWS
ncbi:MAG: sulfur carrier protein ThiS adenylyltransferase [Desulfomicrobiaceae bacterium]|nr:sulfur carrier protein ThiS adenylyltransferase ThiF [Desulfomicrobiaceae bacterium]MBC7356683.1 sulfur carrier protein ThiS adenylyltransferase ThiF [Desulfomicrobiaceae bacterium]MBZ4648766.1 UBA/THIF-type binding protein [Desulfomicrobiaceae bacterium]MDI3493296.1 sulfur carrier protein ThiS adenylyltransferase [Desulfomicrobiaceae bacterium]MDK2873878.1 sulfur carrier protein ThiS adenylyltransferase [Desulfomicrobiaceae bacterium]